MTSKEIREQFLVQLANTTTSAEGCSAVSLKAIAFTLIEILARMEREVTHE